jgi:hypothetical protein
VGRPFADRRMSGKCHPRLRFFSLVRCRGFMRFRAVSSRQLGHETSIEPATLARLPRHKTIPLLGDRGRSRNLSNLIRRRRSQLFPFAGGLCREV